MRLATEKTYAHDIAVCILNGGEKKHKNYLTITVITARTNGTGRFRYKPKSNFILVD